MNMLIIAAAGLLVLVGLVTITIGLRSATSSQRILYRGDGGVWKETTETLKSGDPGKVLISRKGKR